MSREARNFLNRMLVVEPDKRATVAQLLEDSWLRSNKNKEAANSQKNEGKSSNAGSTIIEGQNAASSGGAQMGAFLSTNESSGQQIKPPQEGWKQYE